MDRKAGCKCTFSLIEFIEIENRIVWILCEIRNRQVYEKPVHHWFEKICFPLRLSSLECCLLGANAAVRAQTGFAFLSQLESQLFFDCVSVNWVFIGSVCLCFCWVLRFCCGQSTCCVPITYHHGASILVPHS